MSSLYVVRWLSESESEPESVFTIRCAPSGADCRNRSRNLNLSSLYVVRRLAPTLRIGVGTWICLHYTLCAEWRRLSESESEPESVFTKRCASSGADSRNRSRNLNLPSLYVVRRLAPTLGIGVGTWTCLHYTLYAEWRRLSESESEPESAFTIRCAPTSADSESESEPDLPTLYAYP